MPAGSLGPGAIPPAVIGTVTIGRLGRSFRILAPSVRPKLPA